MKYKYAVLGNLAGVCAFGAIAASNVDWRLSIGLGAAGAIIGNYMYIDIKRKVMSNLEVLFDSMGGFIGVKFEDGKFVKISGEANISKDKLDELDKLL